MRSIEIGVIVGLAFFFIWLAYTEYRFKQRLKKISDDYNRYITNK